MGSNFCQSSGFISEIIQRFSVTFRIAVYTRQVTDATSFHVVLAILFTKLKLKSTIFLKTSYCTKHL
jgi:hypothetical protein